ncbi:MAG: hypothetical protein P1U32_00425 [Legionellaceae bacterium]|nr:hypothetical protein [Legionellaceae bacterium]
MPSKALSPIVLHLNPSVEEIELTGIQEKYLTSQLCAEESLTVLDVQRLLDYTDMTPHVQVVHLDEAGELQAALQHIPTSLMINLAPEGAIPEWASVVVTLDESTKQLKYALHTRRAKEALQKAIEAALPIDDSYTVHGEVLESASNGYTALHAIYAHPSNHVPGSTRAKARQFAAIDSQDESAMVRWLYEIQLENIRVEDAERQAVSENIRKQLRGDGRIGALSLNPFIQSLTPDGGPSQEDTVNEQLGELRITSKSIIFPAIVPSSPFLSADYEHFLLSLEEKFQEEEALHPVKHLTFQCRDKAALEGLIAYVRMHRNVPFETLTLDITSLPLVSDETREQALFYLQSALLALSNTNLQTVNIKDSKLNVSLTQRSIYRGLANFVTARAVAIDVGVPDTFKGVQQTIDEVTAPRIRAKNILQLNQVKADELSKLKVKRKLRTRPKLGARANIDNVDIELEEEQEQELELELELEAETEAEKATDTLEKDGKRFLYFSHFTKALRTRFEEKMGWENGHLTYKTIELAPELIIPGAGAQTEADRGKHLAIWEGWLGIYGEEEARREETPKLSLEACQFLLDHQEQFQYGLDLKRLPPGFLLRTEEIYGHTETLIHYDKKLAEQAEYDPLRVQVNPPPQYELPTPEQFEAVCKALGENHTITQKWQQLKCGPYNRVEQRAFKRGAVEQLNDTEKRTLLDALIVHDGSTAAQKLKALFAAVPDLSVGGLLQLYLKYGEAGFDALKIEIDKDPALFKQLNKDIYKNTTSYVPVLSKAYKDAVQTIEGLSAFERKWFDTLLKQHGAAQNNVNLLDLVKAFMAFKKEIGQLETEGNESLECFDNCAFSGVKSMPTALSRIVSLLKHVSKKNRLEQWREVTHLDLSASGMIRAISETDDGNEWAFITRQMEMSMDHVRKGDRGGHVIKEVDVDGNEREVIPAYRYNGRISRWDSHEFSKNKPRLRFFREVAYQEKNAQLSLAFYQKIDLKIRNSGLHEKAQEGLYNLMARVLTGHENLTALGSLQQIEKDFARTLEILKEPILPLGIDAAFGALLWRNFLCEIPGFPLERLNHFIAFARARFHSPLFLPGVLAIAAAAGFKPEKMDDSKSKDVQLLRFIENMKWLMDVYGGCVSEGMKDYKDKAYTAHIGNDDNLFLSYQKIVNAIGNLAFKDRIDERVLKPWEARHKQDEYKLKEDARPIKQALIRLISTFQLQKDGLSAFEKLAEHHFHDERFRAGLDILRHASTEKGSRPALSADDLVFILEEVMASTAPIAEMMKTLTLKNGNKVSQYFEVGFLDEYIRPVISEALKLKLSEVFSDEQVPQVNQLLQQFKVPGDHMYFERITKPLLAICRDLTPIDRTLFLQKLTATADFYRDGRALSEEDHPFVAMLTEIYRKQALDGFIGFMAAERAFKLKTGRKVTEALAERVTLYTKTLLPAFKYMEGRAVSEIEMLPFIREMLLRTPAGALSSATYAAEFQQCLAALNALIKENKEAKRPLLKLFMGYLADDSGNAPSSLLDSVLKLSSVLQKQFSAITDKSLVLSLCMHFDQSKAEDTRGLSPDGLVALFDVLADFDEAERLRLLRVVAALLNANKGYTLEDFKAFVALVKEDNAFLQFTMGIYERAPFPDLKTLLSWHAKQKTSNISWKDSYQKFDIEPCHRELFDGTPPKPLNGFHKEIADAQLLKMKGFTGKIDTARCEKLAAWARGVSSQELLEKFATFNPGHSEYAEPIDYESLVTLVAELLYRSKGRDVVDSKGKMKLGSSMEINPTQYLAILSLLKTDGQATAQIQTGEGKSRIMMIASVCQYALGKTVDFVTSDVQLAQRDFIEFKPFFDMVGAKSSLIFSDSDPSIYRKRGINFSDPSSLNLFRNKAASIGKRSLVIDGDRENRALLLDEADKTYFDMAGTRFNFSRESDASIRDMTWVYPLLIRYFEEEKVVLGGAGEGLKTARPIDLYYTDVDLSREKFLNYAKTRCTKSEYYRLRGVSEAQIEQWQASAVTAANSLSYRKDFAIEPNALIRTPKGTKVSSEARLFFSNRISRDSKFSFGVHPCLHAKLERMRSRLPVDTEKDTPLLAALRTCEAAFHIQDEKQIVYSTTSKNMLDDYKAGSLKAVTGTYGSMIERREARALYGRCKDEPMSFIDVPRDRVMRRVDKAVRLTRNKKQQLDTLMELIKEAREKDQPILIVAENDEESAELYEAINRKFGFVQRIDSQMSFEEERAAINKAGIARQVTISTDMVGRGTDIQLDERASVNGLRVLGTYLPRERDYRQIIGRSGRFGAKGETQLVLDKVRLRKRIGKRTLGKGGFYYNAEAYIRREQALMDRKKQCERLIKNTVGDFKKAITDNFFEDMLVRAGDAHQLELLAIWANFFDKTDKQWNETWPHIQGLLFKQTVSVAEVQAYLDGYAEAVQKQWDALRSQVLVKAVAGKTADDNPLDYLHAAVPPLGLGEETQQLLTHFLLKDEASSEREVFDHYDRAHDGRYVKYTSWTIPAKASLKGWANLIPFVNFKDARPPFANTRAWLAGHGQLFPWLRAGQHQWRMLGAFLLTLLGAGVGVGLTLTGVAAPLVPFAASLAVLAFGQSAFWLTTTLIGLVAACIGALVGTLGGHLVDKMREKPTDAEEEENFKEIAEPQYIYKQPETQSFVKPVVPKAAGPSVAKGPGFFDGSKTGGASSGDAPDSGLHNTPE